MYINCQRTIRFQFCRPRITKRLNCTEPILENVLNQTAECVKREHWLCLRATLLKINYISILLASKNYKRVRRLRYTVGNDRALLKTSSSRNLQMISL